MDHIDDLVNGILEALGMDDDALRARLRDEMARGFELAGDQTGEVEIQLDVEIDPVTREPGVVVLDGGRTERGEPTPKPHLEVLDGDREPAPEVAVQVRRATRPPRARGRGTIAIEEAMQTLYRGKAEHTYRLHLDQGEAVVLLDGEPIEALRANQSMDVSSAHIAVQGTAKGTYERL